MARLNAEIDDELHGWFARHARGRGLTMKQIIESYLTDLREREEARDRGDEVFRITTVHFEPGVEAGFVRVGETVRVVVKGNGGSS